MTDFWKTEILWGLTPVLAKTQLRNPVSEKNMSQKFKNQSSYMFKSSFGQISIKEIPFPNKSDKILKN